MRNDAVVVKPLLPKHWTSNGNGLSTVTALFAFWIEVANSLSRRSGEEAKVRVDTEMDVRLRSQVSARSTLF